MGKVQQKSFLEISTCVHLEKRAGVWPKTALSNQYDMLGGDVSNKKGAASGGAHCGLLKCFTKHDISWLWS